MSNNHSISNADAFYTAPPPEERQPDDPPQSFPLATRSRDVRRHIIVRIAIIIGGTIVLLVGIALLILPGPAFVVIPAGLAILGTELVWARRLLRRVKEDGSDLANGLMQRLKRKLRWGKVKPTDDGDWNSGATGSDNVNPSPDDRL